MATAVGGPTNRILTDEDFEAFQDLFLRETGIFLRDGKRPLVVSRLSKRLRALGLESFAEYRKLLKDGDPGGGELRRAINAITTNKTEFFRERHQFDWLVEHVVREARIRTPPGRPVDLDVWCAACSTGEEVYSIAMTIAEALGSLEAWRGRLLASDIDEDVLAKAVAAMYPQEQVAGIPLELRRKYLLRGTGERRGLAKIRRELRERVTFERINLIAQPADGRRFDAIFCRNVMIYFNQDTQRQVVEALLAKLTPNGHLFVGHSENLYFMNDAAAAVGHAVYRPAGRRRAG